MLDTAPGKPAPLGANHLPDGINFCLYSSSANKVILVLYDSQNKKPIASYTLNNKINKTGNIWHIFIKGIKEKVDYAYYIDEIGPLIDPYAKVLNTSHKWRNEEEKHLPLSKAIEPKKFDWQDAYSPNLAFSELIIYEMHVRSFTIHPSSKCQEGGTFLGLIEKIPHLKALGINAIELMPVMEFNESEYNKINPLSGKKLCNYWGYSTVHFFSLMNRFGKEDTLNEFKTLVRELHKNKIEVILDVVYNHSAEGNEKGPFYSLKGIDKTSYYLYSEEHGLLDYTGCGNTLRANYTPTADLILDSLRYFATECQVDGFRFDLASAMTRGDKGEPLADPSLFIRITEDPILSTKKLIAEAWDAVGLYQIGHFPKHNGLFAEWNGAYRDNVRKFLKGTDGSVTGFADALCGSEKLYSTGRKPHHSINFITAHDGFTLRDLVSYQGKHNLANGENNRDGTNNNDSWNCGIEGETKDEEVNFLRQKQMKNFMVALFMSLGTPMLLMGDEYQHTRGGNNNAWCQDNELNWFLWDECEKHKGFASFIEHLIKLRKTVDAIKQDSFLAKEQIQWHGTKPFCPDWGFHSRFISYTLCSKKKEMDFYFAFNAFYDQLKLELPHLPHGKHWHLIVNTAQKEGAEFYETALKIEDWNVSIEPYSSLILKAL